MKRPSFHAAGIVLAVSVAVIAVAGPAIAQPVANCVSTLVGSSGDVEISNFQFSWNHDRGPYFGRPEDVCIYARGLYAGEYEKTMTLGADCYCRTDHGTGPRYIRPYIWKNVEQTHEKPGSCPGYGNPINPLLGSKTQPLDVPDGLGGLRVLYDTRTKLSSGAIDRGLGLRYPSGFGALWSSALERRLVFQPDGSIFAVRGAHHQVSFTSSGVARDPDVNDRLTTQSGTWRYVDAARQSIDVFNGQGQLVSMATRTGRTTTYQYSDATTTAAVAPYPGLLIRTTDENGRQVQFRYVAGASGKALVRQMTGADGLTTTFDYDDKDNLTGVTWPDQNKRRYVYEMVDLPWAMTGMFDEKDVRTGTYAYDIAGRARSTEGAGGVNRYSVAWTLPPQMTGDFVLDMNGATVTRTFSWQPGNGIEVTLPNGQIDRLTSSAVVGFPQVSTRSQPAGAGCGPATSQQVPDSNGNVVQADDFNGNRVCRSFDLTRNLEIGRVEGLDAQAACGSVLPAQSTLPAGSRRVSTEWHPDWRIETRTAMPRRIETNVYNGQPDPFNGGVLASCAPAAATLPGGKPIAVLCKRVEQATTDESGTLGFNATLQSGVAARVTRWTYNATGQVLTETDPRGKVVVTNEYYTDTTADHTQGDLKATTNAASQLTRFTRYTASGKPLETLDANSVATTYVYDARERLKSVTTGSVVTGYEYSSTDLLERTTQSDGSFVSYEYDAAHRLVAVSDSQGNRVVYTLDNMGNRTKEETKDPQGMLKRTMSRTYDALNRAQQTTGRE
ncbi:RHS repeat domain-containing protein [Roseateles chitinivorans]|uniref:RHS repeat domain-containing protein n=1 Tax=Roseateles chitinivorans TaxID=2917965 RepID=UPI003D66F78D